LFHGKLGYYKVSKQEFISWNLFRITKENQVVGYGKQLKLIFSPSTGAYKQVGGFKAIFDISEYWSWKRSDYHRHINCLVL
jgi:regulator of sigma E protease